LRRIDPDSSRFGRWFGRFCDEAFRVVAESVIEGPLSGGMDVVSLAVMDLIGRHQAKIGMVVIFTRSGGHRC
jgi:hypothetical protein